VDENKGDRMSIHAKIEVADQATLDEDSFGVHMLDGSTVDDENTNAEIDIGVPNNVKYKQVKVEIS
jgi:hypothetical protein